MKFIEAKWAVPEHVKAITTTRVSGISQGAYSGLNVGYHVGDKASDVQHNRQHLKNELQLPSEPIWLNQQHTIEVISEKTEADIPCDGFYTNQLGIVCAIMTADCLPLFITNKEGSEIALLHVGWRGLAEGIIEKGIEKFNCEVSNLVAWSGPAISQQHFEVGKECKQSIGGSEKHYQNSERAGYYYADLYALVAECLANLGVTKYSQSDCCTYTNDDLFYSYRRDGITGRMVSLLWLE